MDIKEVEIEEDIYTCHQCWSVFDDEYEGEWCGSDMWICEDCLGADEDE